MTKTANVTEINFDNDDLTCPITLELFRDPVRAQDGHVYERQAITQWIQEHGTSPLTRQPLQIDQLQSDEDLKRLAKQRRNSTVSYKVENNLITLPIRQTLKTTPNQIGSTSQLKTCLWQPNFCVIIFVLALFGISFGIVFGILHSRSYPTYTTRTREPYEFSHTIRYSSELTFNSSLFNRPPSSLKHYYYEAIRVMIPLTNYYRFRSASDIDMYGLLYKSNFNDLNSTANLLKSNDDGGSLRQFLILSLLSVGNYTLVATTFSRNVTGNFSIMIEGPINVNIY